MLHYGRCASLAQHVAQLARKMQLLVNKSTKLRTACKEKQTTQFTNAKQQINK
jgi:hypothetical protein